MNNLHNISNTLDNPAAAKQSQGVGKELEIYTQRFSPEEEAARQATWKVVTQEFFQNYISPQNDVLIDIGAGDGLFTKLVRAKRKIAVDLSEHVLALRDHGIETYQVPANEFTQHVKTPADVIFMSNFLEHLPDKRILLEVLEECRRGLRRGGTLLILQPNIRYTGVRYWDYVDHHIALTEHSLAEALEVSGFEIVQIIPQFLPYTAKSGLGRFIQRTNRVEQIVRWYLRIPLLWKIFGGQTFVVATPRV